MTEFCPEPTTFNGDDNRAFGSGGGEGRSREAVWWRTYAYAERTGCLEEFLGIYRPMAAFADLVAAAEQRMAQQKGEAA